MPNHFHLVASWLRPLNDLEMDCAAAQDGRMDIWVKLPGRQTQGNALVSIVMTGPFIDEVEGIELPNMRAWVEQLWRERGRMDVHPA